ncbi:exonuclease domain-containing protein [Streptomyces rochei]|uniref:exonuclease domain-containing protein n=1 Tax=Streptomyces rochei TaxID=1928 RepID=UPI0037008F8E
MNQQTSQQAPWYLGRLAGFDLETTGVSPERDRLVTACVVQCGDRKPVASATWMANPGVEIPEGAAAVHGITTERARKEGRPAGEVVEEVIVALTAVVQSGIPIVAMNAAFDLTMLDREARRYGTHPLTDYVGQDLRVVDPFVLDKHVDPYRRGKRTLTDLCRHYQVPLDGAHDAAADALAACRVAWRIASTHGEIGGASIDELHALQIGWAREQAESLADYFRNTPGKEARADGVRSDWPLIPHPRTESR